jgi:hypothetical protein
MENYLHYTARQDESAAIVALPPHVHRRCDTHKPAGTDIEEFCRMSVRKRMLNARPSTPAGRLNLLYDHLGRDYFYREQEMGLP